MRFSSISVLIFMLYYTYNSLRFNGYVDALRYKYKAQTWHYGFFADRKLYKKLNEEDKREFKLKAKRNDRILLLFIVYTIFIFMLSGIFFNGKL
jgi:hypothetical protein